MHFKWIAAGLWMLAGLVFANLMRPFGRDENVRRAVGTTRRHATEVLRLWFGRGGRRCQGLLPARLERWLARGAERSGAGLSADEWRGVTVVAAGLGVLLLTVAVGPVGGGLVSYVWVTAWRALAGGIVGVTLVFGWLHLLVVSRTSRLAHDLPVLADLLLLGLEGGLGLDCALAEAGRLLSGPLRDELREVDRLRMLGVPQTAALREIGARLEIPELAGFVNLLSQAETLGSGLTRAVMATTARFRTARIMEAERMAGTAPVKMLFPLVFCLFPSILVLLLGPILIKRGGFLL